MTHLSPGEARLEALIIVVQCLLRQTAARERKKICASSRAEAEDIGHPDVEAELLCLLLATAQD